MNSKQISISRSWAFFSTAQSHMMTSSTRTWGPSSLMRGWRIRGSRRHYSYTVALQTLGMLLDDLSTPWILNELILNSHVFPCDSCCLLPPCNLGPPQWISSDKSSQTSCYAPQQFYLFPGPPCDFPSCPLAIPQPNNSLDPPVTYSTSHFLGSFGHWPMLSSSTPTVRTEYYHYTHLLDHPTPYSPLPLFSRVPDPSHDCAIYLYFTVLNKTLLRVLSCSFQSILCGY